MNKEYESFFDNMEKQALFEDVFERARKAKQEAKTAYKKNFTEGLENAGPLRKALLWAILNPLKTTVGLAGIGAAAYGIPKLLWARHAARENQDMAINNETLANIAANNYRMAEMMTPPSVPKADKYDYVF